MFFFVILFLVLETAFHPSRRKALFFFMDRLFIYAILFLQRNLQRLQFISTNVEDIYRRLYIASVNLVPVTVCANDIVRGRGRVIILSEN